ncbi:Na+/H+ antiporter NhaA [Streptomyces olivaceoviridis]|uniref:Na+/H+ antiporter NhaA n=1 Tax=Streptomyces olivaceoviridis TaxID=1921 RepID=UPI00332A67C2
MSTDSALALSVFNVMSPHLPGRIRTFPLTLFVVDDLVALFVIAPSTVMTSGRSRRLSRPRHSRPSSSAAFCSRTVAASSSH